MSGEVRVPHDLWDDTLEGSVAQWLYAAGDPVRAGDVVCELMVEKSQFEIAAPVGGVLNPIADIGVVLAKGDLLATID